MSFKYVIGKNNPNNAIDILLCSECSRHLTLEDHDKKKTYKLCKYTWPTFIQLLLKDRDVQSKYGINIWRFITSQWQYWWVDSVRKKCLIFKMK